MAAKRIITGNSIFRETGKAFQIDGIQEILKNVGNVINSVSGKEAKEVFYKAGKELADEIRRNAPIDSGELINAVFQDRGDMGKPDVLVGVGYGKAPHAHLVEYGTEKRFHKSGKYVGYVNEGPFVRPAIAASADKMARIIKSGLLAIIAKHTK